MALNPDTEPAKRDSGTNYRVREQIGHILRRANQRHSAIFSKSMITGVTPTRFAALSMLFEKGPLSQNELGRLTAMDVATIKGVVDRLAVRDLLTVKPDPNDARRNLIELTKQGRDLIKQTVPTAREISDKTLEPLNARERDQLMQLLCKIT